MTWCGAVVVDEKWRGWVGLRLLIDVATPPC